MGTFFVILILLLVAALAVKSIVHRIRHGSACCGERDAPEKKIKVADKNKENYPYTYIMSVDGMHCSNCTRHVENALNKTEGIWATASLEKKSVTIRSKKQLEKTVLEKIVSTSGYTPLSTVLQDS
ncbi:MAG TPA: ATPase P [Treponema sp.]|nr:ATPase P [Treponema sp.]